MKRVPRAGEEGEDWSDGAVVRDNAFVLWGMKIYTVRGDVVADSAAARLLRNADRRNRWALLTRTEVLACLLGIAPVAWHLFRWWMAGASGRPPLPSAGTNGQFGLLWLLIAWRGWSQAMAMAHFRNAGILQDLMLAGERPVVIQAAMSKLRPNWMVPCVALLFGPAMTYSAIVTFMLMAALPAGIFSVIIAVLSLVVLAMMPFLARAFPRSPDPRVHAWHAWMLLSGGGTPAEVAGAWLKSNNALLLLAGVLYSSLLFLPNSPASTLGLLLVILAAGAAVHFAKKRGIGTRLDRLTLAQFEELFAAFIAKQDVHAVLASFSK